MGVRNNMDFEVTVCGTGRDCVIFTDTLPNLAIPCCEK